MLTGIGHGTGIMKNILRRRPTHLSIPDIFYYRKCGQNVCFIKISTLNRQEDSSWFLGNIFFGVCGIFFKGVEAEGGRGGEGEVEIILDSPHGQKTFLFNTSEPTLIRL